MNVLSLFDGASMGMVALERVGIKVDNYYASEIEDDAIKISQDNYPGITRLGDVTRWTDWDIDFSKIDLVIGGSPCQGFSRQGKMLDFDDPRSKLFFVYSAILKEVQRVNPNAKFLLENVHMKKISEDVITEYLGIGPIKINSRLLSAQNRPRNYWSDIEFGVPEDSGIALKTILESVDTTGFIEHEGILFDPSISEKSRNLVYVEDGETRVKQSVVKGYIAAKDGDGINISFPTSISRRGRVIEGKSSTVDTACNLCVYTDGAIRRYTITELERLQTLPDGYTKAVGERARMKAIGNGWTVDVIAHIFSGLKTNLEVIK